MSIAGPIIIRLSVPRKEIETIPISPESMLRAIDILAENAIKERRAYLLELKIGGYGDDKRELFEIPEVCQWARNAFTFAPAIWYFMNKAGQWHFLGWLCGPVAKSQANSPEFLEILDKQKMESVVNGITKGEELLRKHGADSTLLETYNAYHRSPN